MTIMCDFFFSFLSVSFFSFFSFLLFLPTNPPTRVGVTSILILCRVQNV